MPQVEIVHPAELSSGDIAAWTAMQARTPAFAGPLLSPQFAQAVGAVREDARVAIWRRGSEPTGFLAHHRRPMGFARPIGAPFCDYQALVSSPQFEFDAAQALHDARLSAFRFSALLDPFGVFQGAADSVPGEGRRVRLDGSAADYLERLARGSANRLKNYRRYRRKLERDFGPLRIVAETASAAFERLLAWKSRQLQRSGLHDFLRLDWTRALLRRLFETRGGEFAGLMISLYAGDRLVAGHFGVRLGAHYHPWIGAMDRDLEAYAAGSVHQWAAIAAMDELGLQVYDLGPGADHWKRMFASETVALSSGLATASTVGGRLAGASEGIWALPPLRQAGLARRLRNRLDQIAAMELTLGGRVRGVLDAAAGLDRRDATRRSPDA